MRLVSDKWYYNSMPCGGCSDLHGVNPNLKKKKKIPVISPRENNWKLFHLCDVIPCNIMNYLIRRESKRYIIIMFIPEIIYLKQRMGHI